MYKRWAESKKTMKYEKWVNAKLISRTKPYVLVSGCVTLEMEEACTRKTIQDRLEDSLVSYFMSNTEHF
mgnify:CR=1 FL=1